MKLTLLRMSGAMLLTLYFSASFAQITGGNAFMKSTYVELGVGPNGAYVSNGAPPAGYVPIVITGRGLISDSDKDGFAVGSPAYCGDYFAPGSPEEGFAIQANGLYYYNTPFTSDCAGSNINYSNTLTAVNSAWQGVIAANGLQVSQITTVPHGGTVVVVTVQLKNTSAVAINNIYYTRNGDPDNDQEFAGDFTTNNIVVQNHPVDPWAIVTATGLEAGCYLAIASENSNAMASYGGFSTTSVVPQSAWSGVGTWSTSGSTIGDVAIQMTFKMGKLNPGQTKVLNFIYGTNESDVEDYIGLTGDDEVARMEAQLNNGASADFNPEFHISPNPTSGIINIYGYGMNSASTIDLQIINVMGQVVADKQLDNSNGITNNSFELDGSLQNGTYIANFTVDGKIYSQPFILNR